MELSSSLSEVGMNMTIYIKKLISGSNVKIITINGYVVKEFNPNSYITQALTIKKSVIKKIIPNKEAIKLAPINNNQGLIVRVFVSELSMYPMISFIYYE